MSESDLVLRTILLSADDLDAPLRFYRDALGMPERFRDGERYAALDAGAGIIVALAAGPEHPAPGTPVLACKTSDVTAAVDRVLTAGAKIVDSPTVGRHEMRALVRAPGGALISIYGPLRPDAASAASPVVNAHPGTGGQHSEGGMT